MRTTLISFAAAALLSFPAMASPADIVRSSIVTLDSGGGLATSATYRSQHSIGSPCANMTLTGGAVRIVSVLTPPAVTSLVITSNPTVIHGGESAALSGTAWFDDNSSQSIAGGAIQWDAPSAPVLSISAEGLLLAGTVQSDTSSPLGGTYEGLHSVGSLTILGFGPRDERERHAEPHPAPFRERHSVCLVPP